MAPPVVDGTSRTLLMALDAVPYRVARKACSRGAFAGWSQPAALVAPFPSLTHPGFAALFQPFGVAPSWGYEVRHFDVAANRTVGGNPLTYRRTVPPWAEYVDAPRRGLVSKTLNYVSAPRAAEAELNEVFREVLTSSRDVVIAYLGATDGFMHLYEDESLVEFMVELDLRLIELARRHVHERGRPLRVVLFSDHGCGRCPVHYTGSLKPPLRAAGLRVVHHLAGPDDVVAPTFGIVNYSALFVRDASRAEAAARAMAAHQAVELAAYSPAPDLVDVLSRDGRARIRWRCADEGTRFRYEDVAGDVLELAGAVRRLSTAGLLDAEGFAHEDDWLRETAFEPYPDPLRRLADALIGGRIRSRASVLLSLGPGWSWGWRSAFAGGLVRGGRLKGTHGGLDRESTLGFLLVNDPMAALPPGVRADTALAPFAEAVRAGRPSAGGG